ncbi:hypothetical protein [Microbulbifer hainanensis]|uniref:hypothetical protein n=1 Tax=Microbulbifer hainanensis TaxID=2735675 RepID=UPI0018688714|nr:hypothetical protein [Microbulbifer hainanensis]
MAQLGIGGFDSGKYRDTITPPTQSKSDTDMSFSSLTDNQGNRYLLSLGHRLQPIDAIEFQQAVQALERIDAEQLFTAEREIFHFQNTDLYQQLERRLGKNWRSARETELNLHSPVGTFPGRWAIILDAIYHGDLRFTKVAAHKEEQPPSPEEDNRGILRVKIRQALSAIVVQEKAETARHSTLLSGETPTTRALIYGGAFLTGLWNAGTDFAQWLKEVNDVTNPLQRSLRGIHSSFRALQRNSETGEDLLAALEDEVLAAEKRELVQVLGFDPTAITREQFHRATEMADFIWDDPALQVDIRQFVKDYVKAQHPIEITEFSGAAAFEVLFTILLTAVTAGTGLAASAAGQARHFAKFRKVGDLLMEFAEQTKKIQRRLRRNGTKVNSTAKPSFDGLPVEDIEGSVKTKYSPTRKGVITEIKNRKEPSSNSLQTNPENIRAASKHWDNEKASKFKDADDFYESVGYKDYDSHLRGIDFDQDVEVIEIKKGDKLYQYSYLDRKTGEPKVGSYFYSNRSVDVSKLGFDVDGREMIELEVLEDAKILQSRAANIEDWNDSGKIFPGGESQLFNPNLNLSSPKIVE